MNNLVIEAEAITDKGEYKKVNQDSLLVKIGEYKDSDFGLFVICDGVGGLKCGEIASSYCIEQWKNWWDNNLESFLHKVSFKDDMENMIIEELNRVLLESNEGVIDLSEEKSVKMGTTASALFLYKDKYYISHIGDSRIYFLSKDDISVETEDHTVYNYKLKNGQISEREDTDSKEKHILTQCIGSKKDIKLYNKSGDISFVRTILICSDGFYNKLLLREMKKLCKAFKGKNKSVLLEKYLCEVRKRGEVDNISAIVLNICSKNQLLLGLLSKIKGDK